MSARVCGRCNLGIKGDNDAPGNYCICSGQHSVGESPGEPLGTGSQTVPEEGGTSSAAETVPVRKHPMATRHKGVLSGGQYGQGEIERISIVEGEPNPHIESHNVVGEGPQENAVSRAEVPVDSTALNGSGSCTRREDERVSRRMDSRPHGSSGTGSPEFVPDGSRRPTRGGLFSQNSANGEREQGGHRSPRENSGSDYYTSPSGVTYVRFDGEEPVADHKARPAGTVRMTDPSPQLPGSELKQILTILANGYNDQKGRDDQKSNQEKKMSCRVGQPSKFNGDLDKYQEFRNTFLNYADLTGKTGKEAIHVCGTYLEGKAAAWFGQFKLSELVTPDGVEMIVAFFDLMREIFCPETQISLVRHELADMKQGRSETMDAFVDRFEKKSRIVGGSKDLLLSYFVRGVSGEVRRDFTIEPPKTLEKAYERAKVIFKAYKSQKAEFCAIESRFSQNDSWRGQASKVMQPPTSPKVRIDSSSANDKAPLTERLVDLLDSLESNRNDTRDRREPRNSRKSGGCWFCGKSGHSLNNCWALQKSRKNYQAGPSQQNEDSRSCSLCGGPHQSIECPQ